MARLAQDNFILFLLVCSLLGIALGFFGTLLVYIVLAWHHVITFVYSVFSVGAM